MRAECQAVRATVGIYETTNYGKYEVTGRGARAWLDRVFASRIPKPGRLALAPMLNAAGRIVGDLSIACLAEDRFLIVGSGFAEEFHMRWFWQPASRRPMCSCARRPRRWPASRSPGPTSRELLQRLVREDSRRRLSSCSPCSETAVGFAPAILTRAGFTGELGYEIWTTPDYFATLYEELWEAGRDLGLVHFGGRALSSLRLEKAYGSFNKDFRPDYTPGRNRSRSLRRLRQGRLRRPRRGARRARGRPEAPLRGDGGRQRRRRSDRLRVDHEGRQAVGYVTSGAYGHCIGKSIAAGYVPAALARDGERFEIDILGEMRTAIVRLEPLYDPQGLRLRG